MLSTVCLVYTRNGCLIIRCEILHVTFVLILLLEALGAILWFLLFGCGRCLFMAEEMSNVLIMEYSSASVGGH